MKSAPVPRLHLDQQLCFPLYAAANLVVRLYRPLLAELGLTYPQYLVMLALWQSAPLTVGEVGARLQLDSGTLTPLLKRMEAAGLVVRERTADDERRVAVSLTPKGARLRGGAEAVPGELLCRVGLAPADAVRLREELKDLVHLLEGAAAEAPRKTAHASRGTRRLQGEKR